MRALLSVISLPLLPTMLGGRKIKVKAQVSLLILSAIVPTVATKDDRVADLELYLHGRPILPFG